MPMKQASYVNMTDSAFARELIDRGTAQALDHPHGASAWRVFMKRPGTGLELHRRGTGPHQPRERIGSRGLAAPTTNAMQSRSSQSARTLIIQLPA